MIPDKVFFRVDAGLRIGSGHVMRCLTLAKALKEKGVESVFISRPHKGNLVSLVRKKGFEVINLSPPLDIVPYSSGYEQWLGGSTHIDAKETLEAIGCNQKSSWMITDHYGIDDRWERPVRDEVSQIVVIDDLANRKHNCDFLIDSSFKRDNADYLKLVSEQTRILSGTKYCLLRKEFSSARPQAFQRAIRSPPHRILVSLGGVDVKNMTQKVIKELEQSNLSDRTCLDVVIGFTSPHAEVLRSQASKSRLNVSVHQGVSNMAERLLAADLCIGAVGSSVWERCCLGCPSLVATLAANQQEGAKRLETAGVVVSFEPMVTGQLRAIIDGLSTKKLQQLSDKGLSLVDGLGATRVVQILLEQE